MFIIKRLFRSLSRGERFIFIAAAIALAAAGIARGSLALEESSEWVPVRGGSWYEGVIGQPIAINPIISDNQVDQDISRLIYSPLSELIDSYEVEDDGRTYVLKLKEGLLWSNGRPLTSDDVIFTIETIQDPNAKSPLSKNWQGVAAERISELRIRLSLPAPYAFMTQNFERLPIIPVHIFGSIPAANLRLSQYNLEPVGSGPYKFHEFVKRRDGFIKEYHLKINENYAGEKPFIKDFYFVFYENAEALQKDFSRRRIKGFGRLTPVDFESLPSFAELKQIPMPSYYAVFLNSSFNLSLQDQGLRKALDEAIDKRRIIEEVFENRAELINGPLGRLGAVEEVPYRPENIGQSLNFTLIVPQIDFLAETAAFLKEFWEVIGVNVNVVTLPPQEIVDNVLRTSDYEMVLFGNVLENPLDLFPFWHSSQRFSPGLNLSFYKNPKVDTLIEKVRQTTDTSEQRKLAQAAEKLIVEEKPAIFLYSLPYTYVHTSDLRGFGFDQTDEFIITPADRFKNITKWHVEKVRVLR